MFSLELMKKDIKNIPEGATGYNFHRNCFTKKIDNIDYHYFDQHSLWRINSNYFKAEYTIPLDNLILVNRIIAESEELSLDSIKYKVISDVKVYKHINR